MAGEGGAGVGQRLCARGELECVFSRVVVEVKWAVQRAGSFVGRQRRAVDRNEAEQPGLRLGQGYI